MKTGFAGYYQRGVIVATGEEFGYRPIIKRNTFDSPLRGVPDDTITLSISVATDEKRRPLNRREIVALEDGSKYVVANIIQSGLYSILNEIKNWDIDLVEVER